MADPNDVIASKLARKAFIKSKIDLTLADLRVSHGVLYIRGSISREKGAEFGDIRTEVDRIARIVRSQPGIRDVVVDCQFRGQ